MLAVTYNNKTYNVLVEEMSNTSQLKSQGGIRHKQSKQSTQRNKRKQNRSKPTRRIKR